MPNSNTERRLTRLSRLEHDAADPDPDLTRRCREAVETYLDLLRALDLPEGWVEERVATLPRHPGNPLADARDAYDLLMDALRHQGSPGTEGGRR